MERFLIPLLEALGINSGLAVILAIVFVALLALFMMVGRIMIKQAAMDNRQEMQAQHFDVVERDAERAKQSAHNAYVLFVKAMSRE